MKLDSGTFAFIALGGVGEIGANLFLYHFDQRWLAVDCGLTFGDSSTPEFELLVPDPAFIAERREQLVGLVLTHAHEDHLGAVAWLWPQLECPVYATPFAAAILRRKLGERGLAGRVPLHVYEPGGSLDLLPFSLRFVRMAHSTPEAQAVVIRVPGCTVLHSGDWKLDPSPLVGPPTDEAALAALGEGGVDVLVCDSTNALVEGHSGSEAEVRRNLIALVRGLKGRVAITCFATNVARIESIARAAEASGRTLAIVGRAFRNVIAAAREAGYLADLPEMVDEEDAGSLPDDAVLLLVAGSQGEPRSALSRIAADTHPHVALGEGDTVIYSSRMIPGNERAIHRVQEALARRGVRVMTERDHVVHVSGHPARDELRRLYTLVRPRHVVPMHGEWLQMMEHAELARVFGAVPHAVDNGDVLRLAPEPVAVIGHVGHGKLAVDGERLVPTSSEVFDARRRMLDSGLVVASIVADTAGRCLGRPVVSAPGVFDATMNGATDALAEGLAAAVASLPPAVRRDDEALRDAARGALRSLLRRAVGPKRPAVEVHVLRVS
ncbi:MAG: ribonuclease J [Elioraea sp.]|nr:ribonuclease J [Elioraea sp.]